MEAPAVDASLCHYAWAYEGEEKAAVTEDNLQIGKTGDTLKHDVFGLCTLLDSTEAAEGSFKIKVHSDDRICETTRDHVQLADISAEMTKKPEVPSGDNNLDGGAAGTTSDVSNATSEDGSQPSGTANGAGIAAPTQNADAAGQNGASLQNDDQNGNGDRSDKPEDTSDTQDKQELFDKVIAAVAAQASEFSLDLTDGQADIVFYRTLVSAAQSSCAFNAYVCVPCHT
eukprot:6177312-Pleurochrysis_carterae.AAC.1